MSVETTSPMLIFPNEILPGDAFKLLDSLEHPITNALIINKVLKKYNLFILPPDLTRYLKQKP